MNGTKKLELLGSAPVWKALLALGIPTMIGMMISAVYNLVDAYFVGGLGTNPMGAISVTYPLNQVVVGIGLLFGNGAASYISRLLGQGKRDKAGGVASAAIYGGLGTGLCFIALSLVFLTPILKLLGATAGNLPYARSYAGIMIAACVFNIFNVMMNNILSSEGAAKTSMLAMLSGAVLNMILDPIFITVLNLGIAGAAIASAIGQAVSSAWFLIHIIKGKSLFSFRLKDCCFSRENLSEIFKIGVPTFIFQLLTSVSIILINNCAGRLAALFGEDYADSVIAGMGLITRVVSMGTLMVFGFIKGMQPIAGFSYGAKKYDRLRETVKTSVIWSTCFCLVFGLTAALFSEGIASAFTKDDAIMVDIGAKALFLNGLTFTLFGFYTVYSSLFLALGKGSAGFFLGSCRQGICFIPIILLLPSHFGVNGIIYAQPAADIIAFLIAVIMAFVLKAKLKAEEALLNS